MVYFLKKTRIGVLGGTFDHFHKGHQKFLEYGLSISERLIVGVTSDGYIKKFKIGIQNLKSIELFTTRKKSVKRFLEKNAKGKFEIVKIDDIFGPTLDKNFNANIIVVSNFTRKAAEKINEERVKRRLPRLEVVELKPVLAEDGIPISSFRIRVGEIDREGKPYIKKIWLRRTLYLPQNLREAFQKPWGEIIKDPGNIKIFRGDLIISVGDVTSQIFNKFNIKPDISVVDFKVARKEKFSNIKELGFSGSEKILRVKNPPGTLAPKLWKAVSEALEFNEKTIIKIDGEEDLSVVPLVLSLPLESLIFYGQPAEGIAKIMVDENIKAEISQIVSKFKTL